MKKTKFLKAVIENRLSSHGKTADYVRCPCGALNYFYVWSWAGHGALRCIGCEWWILYRSLKVVPPAYFKK